MSYAPMRSALLTDLYQLTMAAGYHRLGMARQQAAFHLFFRKLPFGGGYAIASGVQAAVDYLAQLRFTARDRGYLATLQGADDQPLFQADYLDYLVELPRGLGLNVDAVRDGTPVFPRQPLLRISGPLLSGQIVETPLLNLVNFETLIATKASRIVRAAGGPVLEFGLRRAQGPDGAMSATRAAWIGGVASTSNVLAGQAFGVPVRGTHAHAWVMCFPDERAAFEGYAAALPNNVLLLVDTYDTAQGIEHAIETGQRLAASGHRLLGVRLDSGDLVALSQLARRRLDEAGLSDAVVVASDDLDEHRITALREAGARIDVWGVGTRLVTGHDQPALGGVYKLAAIRAPGGPWRDRVKKSEEPAKISLPGPLGVRRQVVDGQFVGDILYNVGRPLSSAGPVDRLGRPVDLEPGAGEELLVPLLRGGARVEPAEGLSAARGRAAADLASLPAAVRRLEQPAPAPMGLDRGLYDETQRLLAIGGGAS